MADLNITREEFYALYKKAKLQKYQNEKRRMQEVDQYRYDNYDKVKRRNE